MRLEGCGPGRGNSAKGRASILRDALLRRAPQDEGQEWTLTCFLILRKNSCLCSAFVLDSFRRTTIIHPSCTDERALSRTSRGGVGCDGTVAVVEALCVVR